MTKAPRVSFIVTCYNYQRFLPQALDSLLAQTHEALEIIAIDDASTDDSATVLRRYESEPRVRAVYHDRNRGHIRSYNEGLAMARGEFVGVLAADDYALNERAVERQVAVFDAHPDVGLVYTAHALVHHDGATVESVPWPADYVRGGYEEFRHLVWSNYVPHSGTLLRREVQTELGAYDERLPHSGDWDMWLRAAARHGVGYLSQPMYAYRIHQDNMSHARVPPSQAIDELELTLRRAFAALPENAPADLRYIRRSVLRHALLQTAWVDLYHGRRGRSWRGAAYALRREPSVAAGGEFWRFLPRLLLMTVLGRDRFRAAMEAVERRRRRSVQAVP